jgi:hypothetical protein
MKHLIKALALAGGLYWRASLRNRPPFLFEGKIMKSPEIAVVPAEKLNDIFESLARIESRLAAMDKRYSGDDTASEVMGVKDAASYLKVSTNQIRSLIRSGALSCSKPEGIKGKVYLLKDDLKTYATSKRKKSNAELVDEAIKVLNEAGMRKKRAG